MGEPIMPRLVRYDEFEDYYIYEIGAKRWINLSGREVREHGANELLRHLGYHIETSDKRLPVIHHGRVAGSLPADFEPWRIKSTSFLYDPRPGDFRREGEQWIAANSLGPGDLECVPGFVRDEQRP